MDVGGDDVAVDGDGDATRWRLETADDPPVSWPLDGATVDGAADGGLDVGGRLPAAGDLLRLAVVNVREVAEEVDEAAAVRAIRFALVGVASQSRAGADCWSRILFQCHARYAPLTADAIAAAADASEGARPMAGGMQSWLPRPRLRWALRAARAPLLVPATAYTGGGCRPCPQRPLNKERGGRRKGARRWRHPHLPPPPAASQLPRVSVPAQRYTGGACGGAVAAC